MIDFSTLKGIDIPEGKAVKISVGDTVLWQAVTESSEPENLIVGFTDGKYTADDGGVYSSGSLSMAEAHGLIPGRTLRCTLWADPNTTANTASGWKADGTYVLGGSSFSWTALGNDLYECVIPENVEILRFNILKTQEETAVCYMPND